MSIFTGAGVAIITPFNEDGSINFEEFGKIIEDQIAGHTDAIIVCGTTGESSTMDDDEPSCNYQILCRKGSRKNSCYCRNRF